MWSNCFIWAHWRERQLWREWEHLGRPRHMEPCIQRRTSRLDPPWVRHWVVGWWHHETRTLEDIESFVPDDKRPLRPWQLWSALCFRGHVKSGDNPSLPPENEP